MDPELHAYLKRVEATLGGLKRNERGPVMREIRDHLREDIARREADGQDAADAVRDAIDAFGEPEDLAFAYGAGGGIVQRSTGDRILDIAVLTGRGVGKGVGGVAKFLGIAALVIFGGVVLLTLGALLFGAVLVTAFDDEISEAVPRPAYDRHEERGAGNAWFTAESDAFSLPPDAAEIRIFLSVTHEDLSGGLTIELVDPDGRTTTLSSGSSDSSGQHSVLAAMPGTWNVNYRATGFIGEFGLDIMYHVEA